MKSNLENLYRAVIMDHYKNPRNKGLKGYPHIHLKNPSCGDDITIEALVKDGKVLEVRHEGKGCSICCSSASVLTEVIKGKSVDEAKEIIENYFSMMKGEEIDDDRLEEALVYEGVSQFPARIKCATISWKALERLLNGEEDE